MGEIGKTCVRTLLIKDGRVLLRSR